MDIRIENTPLSGAVRAISSKSDVHRFLIAAALSDGCSDIRFTTLSDDIRATAGALRALCADISLCEEADGWHAKIQGNRKKDTPPALFAGECGTTARLLLPWQRRCMIHVCSTARRDFAAGPLGRCVRRCGEATWKYPMIFCPSAVAGG